jgi:SPP1 gp7 family putative phage head morphogenesis protein
VAGRDPHKEALNASLRHSIRLERYKASVVREIARMLDRTLPEVEEILARRLDRVLASGEDFGPATTKRALDLAEEIGEVRAEAIHAATALLRGEMQGLSEYEAAWQASSLQAIVRVELGVSTPTAEQLRAAAFERPFEGAVFEDWARGILPADLDRLHRTIQMAAVEGKTVAEVTREIVGTRKDRDSGTLGKTRRGAEAVARTALNHVATQAREETYRANDDLVQGVRIVATLDGRTTLRCASLDGQVFRVNEGPRPPLHFNCRTTTLPIIEGVTLVNERPSVGRGGEIGQVPSKTTYESWLREQPEEFQDEVLGPTRASLFRDGGVKLERFVDDSGETLTLDELRSRESKAFAKIDE